MMGKETDRHISCVSEVPIQFVRGVGPKQAALFTRLGVATAEDLLWHVPWRYEDRSTLQKINELSPGHESTIVAQVEGFRLIRTRRPSFTIFEVSLSDSTGMFKAKWFNQSYLNNQFKHGQLVMLSGVVHQGRRRRVAEPEMHSPVYEIVDEDTNRELLHVGRLVPIYHGTKGISSRLIRSLVKRILDEHGNHLRDVVPPDTCERVGLIRFDTAMTQVHFPDGDSEIDTLNRGRSNAHQRLTFDELFLVELGLGLKRSRLREREHGIAFRASGLLPKRLRQHLPFTLTDAQERVIREISTDMESPYPMNRLLQGDVGSGKTIVAAFAMVRAAESGYQSAVLAPTEILAKQHFGSLRRLLDPLGLRCALLVGGQSKEERRRVLEGIGTGGVTVTIGTHALLHDTIQFNRLGIAIIDEQHKFGVLQRAMLKVKGMNPDILVMTATPIPRTLALTVYGDLDVSTIDTRPPGRKPIHTIRVLESQRAMAYRLVQKELRDGRQGFVVYPLVEESEKLDLQAAVSGWKHLKGIFHDHSIGLIHGRMSTPEKDAVMNAFIGGTIHLLVSTSVIEVGIDIPNATIMVIEHAERYGLAQLHQLRGRIGRGPALSTCILMTKGRSDPETIRRLDTIVNRDDGFAIAEEDLMMRGPGDFFGTRQWGLPELRVANLIRDVDLLEEARTEAFRLLREDPHLDHPDHTELKAILQRRWKGKLNLLDVS